MMEPKLRTCLVSIQLPRLNLGIYIHVVATLTALHRFWLDNFDINDNVLPILECCLVMNKIIELIGTWRTIQENSTTTITIWLWSWLIN
jgi:hypothetical protein